MFIPKYVYSGQENSILQCELLTNGLFKLQPENFHNAFSRHFRQKNNFEALKKLKECQS